MQHLLYESPDLFKDSGKESYDEDKMGSIISKLQKNREAQKTRLPDPIDCIKKVMEERGLKKSDLKMYIGSSGNVSEVLQRKRSLSLRMIRNLNQGLKIPARILIQDYDLKKN